MRVGPAGPPAPPARGDSSAGSASNQPSHGEQIPDNFMHACTRLPSTFLDVSLAENPLFESHRLAHCGQGAEEYVQALSAAHIRGPRALAHPSGVRWAPWGSQSVGGLSHRGATSIVRGPRRDGMADQIACKVKRRDCAPVPVPVPVPHVWARKRPLPGMASDVNACTAGRMPGRKGSTGTEPLASNPPAWRQEEVWR